MATYTPSRQRRYSLNDTIPATSYDSAVTSWATRIVNAGGAYPSASIAAVNRFYLKLVDANLVSKMYAVNCVVPDGLVACKTPLIATSGSNLWTGSGFTTSDLTVNGLIGNASNYLDTGFKVSTDCADTGSGVTFYVPVSADSGASDCGANTNAPNYNSNFAQLASLSGQTYGDCNTGDYPAYPGRIIVAGSGRAGYFSANRTSLSLQTSYFANSTTAHGSLGTATGTVADNRSVLPYNVYFFCLNLGGSPYNPTNRRFSFFALHKGLVASESELFFSAIQQLRVEIGGGYI